MAHLATRLARRTPESYSDCLSAFAEAGTISTGLAERLGQMARFWGSLAREALLDLPGQPTAR